MRNDKKKSIINFDCPARRIMNSLDYKDVKIGLIQNYTVYGFYQIYDKDENVLEG